jgi:hypothetical protein
MTSPCPICDGDGWYAYPSLLPDKGTIYIRKVVCPRGCPLKDNEPGVELTSKVQ